jgi:hypothetical protein
MPKVKLHLVALTKSMTISDHSAGAGARELATLLVVPSISRCLRLE